jgi:hypothetical protein
MSISIQLESRRLALHLEFAAADLAKSLRTPGSPTSPLISSRSRFTRIAFLLFLSLRSYCDIVYRSLCLVFVVLVFPLGRLLFLLLQATACPLLVIPYTVLSLVFHGMWLRAMLPSWLLKQQRKCNPLVYIPLPLSSTSIRVIRIKAGTAGSMVKCELIVGLLADMQFEALSYVRGDALAVREIRMDDRPFYVSSNLHRALHGLRRFDRDRSIWIDALSINQHDNTERVTQVQMMRDIYGSASRTVIWLDDASDVTTEAFNVARRIHAAPSSM